MIEDNIVYRFHNYTYPTISWHFPSWNSTFGDRKVIIKSIFFRKNGRFGFGNVERCTVRFVLNQFLCRINIFYIYWLTPYCILWKIKKPNMTYFIEDTLYINLSCSHVILNTNELQCYFNHWCIKALYSGTRFTCFTWALVNWSKNSSLPVDRNYQIFNGFFCRINTILMQCL